MSVEGCYCVNHFLLEALDETLQNSNEIEKEKETMTYIKIVSMCRVNYHCMDRQHD